MDWRGPRFYLGRAMARKKKQIRFTSSDLLRSAYMAGAGYSASEIAEAIGGGVTAQSVYSLLGRHAIRLAPKTRAQISFPIVVNRALFESVERAALRCGADPKELAGRLLDALAFDVRLLNQVVAKATGREAVDPRIVVAAE